jgi:hypothetical protein
MDCLLTHHFSALAPRVMGVFTAWTLPRGPPSLPSVPCPVCACSTFAALQVGSCTLSSTASQVVDRQNLLASMIPPRAHI